MPCGPTGPTRFHAVSVSFFLHVGAVPIENVDTTPFASAHP
jgi:hypothetical protein